MNNRPLTKQEVDEIYKKFDRMLYRMPSTTDFLFDVSLEDKEFADKMLEAYRLMFLFGYVAGLKVD